MNLRLLSISSLFILLLFPYSQARELGGNVSLPVMGSVVEESANRDTFKYILQSHSTKAHAPIEGSVYYVGKLDAYGLCVIIKNAHKISVVGNLDRSYVIKNQYLMQGDHLGSVSYHSKVIFILQQIQKTKTTSNQLPITTSPPNLAQNFQNKLFDFAQKGKRVFLSAAAKIPHLKSERILNYEDVSQLLKEVGFPEHTIPTMYCIAKWESGLNPKALNFNDNNTIDVGLFQINSSWFKKCNTNIAMLYNEKENTRCALTVLKKQGFPAWTTYNKNKNRADYCY